LSSLGVAAWLICRAPVDSVVADHGFVADHGSVANPTATMRQMPVELMNSILSCYGCQIEGLELDMAYLLFTLASPPENGA